MNGKRLYEIYCEGLIEPDEPGSGDMWDQLDEISKTEWNYTAKTVVDEVRYVAGFLPQRDLLTVTLLESGGAGFGHVSRMLAVRETEWDGSTLTISVRKPCRGEL